MSRYFIALFIIASAAQAHPIDDLIGDTGRQPVSDALFARRLYLDLWGLVPAPGELEKFEQDRSPRKRELLVDRLLAGRERFADHWISFWNDLLRNDEGVVYHGERKSITHWLRQTLVGNMPYDEFVRTLLNPAKAGGAEGFLIGVNWRGDVSASERPPMQAAQNSAQVFLGVNLKCNSCHDSFISRWKLRDAYGMAAFFSDRELEIVRCDVPTGEKAAPRFLFPEFGAPEAATPDALRESAARLFTTPQNSRFPRTYVNRVWGRLFGRALVEPVDEMDNKPWSPELLDWLASDFAAHGYDTRHLLRRILTSRAYQLPADGAESRSDGPYRFRGPLPRRLTAEQFVDSISSITGEWRVLESRPAGTASYAREWRIKSSPLTRALGRPIRDQVATTRLDQPTTLQALELVNGDTLTTLLHRGARRMLGALPPSPSNLFDSGVINANKAEVDIDISGATQLWLLMEDVDSYDPSRVLAGWSGARLVKADVETPLWEMPAREPLSAAALRFRGEAPAPALIGKIASAFVFDIADKGFTRFRAAVGVDQSSLNSAINPRIRFFVFTQAPDRHQLVNVAGGPPVASPAWPSQNQELVEKLYRHALARPPSEGERKLALEFLAEDKTAGLEDLLWSLFLTPEFQYIR